VWPLQVAYTRDGALKIREPPTIWFEENAGVYGERSKSAAVSTGWITQNQLVSVRDLSTCRDCASQATR
jgi:hypothetical protein